ncbi:hypothetical protein AVEN_159088-1 [Araneus ventricosus]|uniref:Uncharacterized protein n=1 Tax=Araneus ventricosus TaxID=182803 RepID=A0A4Y2B835_ARAVE|nr:hypothetical protein AVEN_159088-1 [Araneus ventricosus]
MEKWLKTETLKRSASRTEIRTTDLAAMEITVDQQDDNHEVQRPTDWSAQLADGTATSSRDETISAVIEKCFPSDEWKEDNIVHRAARFQSRRQYSSFIVHPFLNSEIDDFIKNLKRNKAPGPDGIPNEVNPTAFPFSHPRILA